MEDRSFTEVDLRLMLSHASGIRPDAVEGRWVVDSHHEGREWEVILEPDAAREIVVAVTAFPVGVDG